MISTVHHRTLQSPEVGRVGLCAVYLWLSRWMGFDILMPLSGIDALVGAIERKPSGPDLWQRRTTGNRLGRVAR